MQHAMFEAKTTTTATQTTTGNIFQQFNLFILALAIAIVSWPDMGFFSLPLRSCFVLRPVIETH